MDKQDEENTIVKGGKKITKKAFKFLLIFILLIIIIPVILVSSLRIVYKENTSDSAFKDHREEYKQLD